MNLNIKTLSFPANELEFDAKFAEEFVCQAYLRQKKHELGFSCVACGHNKFWLDNIGYDICCQCEHQHSVTCGTLFLGAISY